jgi:hypothetical protein
LRGVSANEYSSAHGAQINFGVLTLQYIYPIILMHVKESKKDTIVVFMSDNGGNNFPKIEPNKPLRKPT